MLIGATRADIFFENLTNEVRVTQHTPKGQMSLWTLRRAGARNECLDCTVIVLFCADKVGLQKKTQKEWDLLEAIIQPNQNDLFALTVEPPVDLGRDDRPKYKTRKGNMPAA